MRIDNQARNFSLTGAMRNHAGRRLRFALACCDDYIPRRLPDESLHPVFEYR